MPVMRAHNLHQRIVVQPKFLLQQVFKADMTPPEDLLKQELGLDDNPLMKVVRTHDRHMPIDFRRKARPVIEQDATTNMRLDGNNVDIDIEMAEVAKNQLYYSALATALGGHISKLKSVINSGQGS